MHTFSCAVQSVDVDGTAVSFAADPQDYGLCRLTIGDKVVTFNRNGMAVGWERIEPPADPSAEDAEVVEPDHEPEPEPDPKPEPVGDVA